MIIQPRVFILERARHIPIFHPSLRIAKIGLILNKAIKKNYILNYIYNFKSQVEDRLSSYFTPRNRIKIYRKYKLAKERSALKEKKNNALSSFLYIFA